MRRYKLNLFLESNRLAIPTSKDESKSMLETFGLFGDSANNGNTFYPGLNVPEDVVPKEEDFVRVPFRMISATIVAGGSWRATNFGAKPNALKASVKKLVGKPLYVNHDTDDVRNHVGVVESAVWTEANGDVPAGIDGIVKIDAKANPKVARGVLMEPAAIGSTSVTVVFEYEPSHKLDSDHDFENQVGNTVDDKMVTRNVTKVVDFHELSLVWLGADPFAKKLDDNGKPINVDNGSVFESAYNKELYEKKQEFCAKSCFSKMESIHLSKHILGKPSKNKKEETMKKITLAALMTALGIEKLEDAEFEGVHILSPEQHTELSKKGTADEELTQKVGTLESEKTTLTEDLETEKGKVSDLEAEKSTWEAEKVELEKDAALSKTILTEKRNEVKQAYKLSVETGASKESILTLIDKASSEELDGMLEEYGKKISGKFSGTCKDCNSNNIELRSSIADKGDDNTSTFVKGEVGAEQIRAKKNGSSMHLGQK